MANQLVVQEHETFLRESDCFNLKYRCEDCIHVESLHMSCSLEYPNERLIGPKDELPDDILQDLFCKYFELT